MFPINPYVAGNPVGDSPAFVGRFDVLQEVLRVLRHPKENAIVLYGQRRIGKTSVLQELAAKLPKEGNYRPVYFDLQDKVRWPLEKVLRELAENISVILNQSKPDLGVDPETAFRQQWLLQWLGALPADTSLVLLFDEFDVLVDHDSKNTSEAFFRYLRQLLNADTQRLKFVFVIGRNIDDLTNIAQSLFKGTSSKRVSLLSQEDTIKLVHLSETNNTLYWSKEAIEKVWQLTNGHPFLTQRLCSRVWERLHDDKPVATPTATLEEVETAVPSTLDASRNTLEWLWGGLPPAERVVASALAEAGSESITENQLQELLKQSGVQVVIRELQNAPRLLQDWDLIEGTAKDGYHFRVELLRRWIAELKPLNRVREELDRVEPVADLIYQAGVGLYRVGKLEDALSKVREAVKLNPNHLAANQLLAEILLAQNQPNEARDILERLYTYQPDTTRPRLIQALLESAQASESEEEQLKYYERALELEVNNLKANQRVAEILLAKGQTDKAREILERLYKDKPDVARPLLIKTLLTQAQNSDNESKKSEIYKRLLEVEPENAEAKQWVGQQLGKQAEEEGNLKVALNAYRLANLENKAMEVEKKIQDFENFLNTLVKNSEEVIATIFIYGLKSNLVLFHSQVDSPESVAKWSLGELREIPTVLNQFGKEINRGSLKYAVFQLTDNILSIYFLDDFEVLIAVGFVSAMYQGLGNFGPETEKHIDEIKDKLRQLFKQKNESV